MDVSLLASELTHRTIWYPTILGVLVVVAGIILFCGSCYLLLATNVGARLGFLIAFTGLMAFMVVLSSLWITTASPLNTLKGSIPSWKVQEVVPSLGKAKTTAVRDIIKQGRKVDTIEAANVKAAVDGALVTKVAIPSAPLLPDANKYAKYGLVTEYLVTKTYEQGGSNPSFLDFEFRHQPLYAVVQFCGTAPNTQPFGAPPDAAKCAAAGSKEAENNGYMVLLRDWGSVRLPPLVAWVISILGFILGLVCLTWFEKDQTIASRIAARKNSPAAPAPAQA